MNNPKNRIPQYASYILILLWGIACFAFFQGWYHYHFFYQEQNQLFLWSSDYLSTYFSKPAWFACMSGDFLTQFYYYLFAGPVILTVSLLILGDLCRRSLQKAGIQSNPLTTGIAIIIMTIEALFSLHYDYRLSSIIAFAGGAGTFLVSTFILTRCRKWVSKTEKRHEKHIMIAGIGLPHWLSFLSIAISTPVCFWLFGYGVWIYAVLVIVGCILNIKESGNYLRTAALILPLFLLMLSKRSYYLDFETLYAYPGMGEFVKPQLDLEKTFAVSDEYYFGNYNKVVKIVEEDESPNPYMKFYYNLVMAQRGILPDKLLAFPGNNLGTFEKVGPDTPTLTILTINELYWLLGDMTFAERATILANVMSPDKRNIRFTKRLAEINLVSGNQNAAKKYLYILQKTFVYKNWANQMLDALDADNRHAVNHQADTDSLTQVTYSSSTLRSYQEKAKFINKKDTLRLGDNGYTIMQELLESNPENHIALDYLLCSDLLLKDMETFKHDYDTYYLKQKNPHYEKLYQEALMIYLAGTNAPQEEWQKYIKRMDIMQRFEQYSQQRGSSAFADTYWYYFDKGTAPKLKN